MDGSRSCVVDRDGRIPEWGAMIPGPGEAGQRPGWVPNETGYRVEAPNLPTIPSVTVCKATGDIVSSMEAYSVGLTRGCGSSTSRGVCPLGPKKSGYSTPSRAARVPGFPRRSRVPDPAHDGRGRRCSNPDRPSRHCRWRRSRPSRRRRTGAARGAYGR
jgi:hypothetical protein